MSDLSPVPPAPHAFAEPPARSPLDLRHWPWSTTLLRGAIVVLLVRWLAARALPAPSLPVVAAWAWGAFSLLLAARWLARLPDGAARAKRAREAGRAWPSRLALVLVPAEWLGLLRWIGLTAAAGLAAFARRPMPARPEGRRLEDRRKGFYDAFFAMNVVSFGPEVLVSSLILSSVANGPGLHVAVHGLELALIVGLVGDRRLVHAGGHVLTPTHLDLRAGARASARIPLAAIAAIEPLGKTRPEAWRRAHGVHRADTGTVSAMDRPNVVITMHAGTAGTWSRWQVERPLPRHLFVYLDDPAALGPAVDEALASAAR